MSIITINHFHYGSDRKQLKRIYSLLKTIHMDQQQAVDTLNATNEKLDKVIGEVKDIKNALADAIANGQTVPEPLAAAIEKAGQKAQELDDLNADATGPGNTEGEGQPA